MTLRILAAMVAVAALVAGGDAAARLLAGPTAPTACTTKQKKQRTAAVTAYRKAMPKQRAAYFKKQKSRKLRAAFVKKQNAKLAALKKTLAACSKKPPPRTTTVPAGTTTAPPPGTTTTPPGTTTAPPAPDLSVTKVANASNVQTGQSVTYSITVRNVGNAFAQNVVLSDALPVGLQLISATSTRLPCAGTTVITCAATSVAPGDAYTVTLAARATQPGTVSNTATVATSVPEVASANNAATATVSVAPPPILPPASTGPPCAPALARGPIVHVGHPSTYTEGATDYGIFVRPTGTVRALVLFVDFSDASASEATTALHGRLAPEVSAWFAEMSGARLALQIEAHNAWLRMPLPSTAYGLSTGGYNEQYVRDAIAVADPAVNFDPYEIVYILPSAGAAIDRGQSPYAFGNGGLHTAERELRHVTYVGPGYREPWVLEHETLHHFGLPDLYDFDPGTDSARHVGPWDLMSTPVGALLAWHTWKLGWIDASAIRCLSAPGQLEDTITPVRATGGVKALVVPVTASRAYVVEAREPIGRDAAICDNGVLVYTVDATVWSGSGPIRVKPAQTGSDPGLLSRCGPLYNAAFDVGPGEVATFTESGVTVEVLVSSPQGYRVRVKRS